MPSFLKRRSTHTPAPASPPPTQDVTSGSKEASAPTEAIAKGDSFNGTPTKRPRASSPTPSYSSSVPSFSDSLAMEYAGRRLGPRSLTPFPPAQFTERVMTRDGRSVTPYATVNVWPSHRFRRNGAGTPDSTLSLSPDKENFPLDRTSTPSPSPSPKKGKSSAEVTRGRSLTRQGSSLLMGAPSNRPRSISISSGSLEAPSFASEEDAPLSPDARLADILADIEVGRCCKALAESLHSNVTSAITSKVSGTCAPPNTPASRATHRDWYVFVTGFHISILTVLFYRLYDAPLGHEES